MHPSATGSALEHARHQSFVARTLGISFAAMAVAPFFLAFRGAPTPGESLVFGFALAHIVAAMLVARTGRLVAGHLIAFCCLVGVSLTLLVGVHAGAGCALAWLVVAQLEAVGSFDKTLARVAGLVTGTTLAGTLLAALAGRLPMPAVSPATAAAIAGLAAVEAAIVCGRLMTMVELMRRGDRARGDLGRAMAEALGDAVVGFDVDGTVVHLSPRCEAFLGAPDHEVAGRGLFDHVHVADRPAFLKLVSDAGHGNDAVRGDFRLRAWVAESDTRGFNEPRHSWIEMRAHGVEGASGDTPQVVAVLRDVTALRQHDLEIENARQSIENAIRSKDHFLANMSHELRTPLNAIIGFSEILASQTLRPADPDKQREYGRIINQSGQHLLSVVNSILDMSKIQSGTFSIIPDPFDVVPLIDLCCDMVALKAEEGGIRLVRDYPETLEEIVGDKRAYKQILLNILSNAVKFTPEQGQVTIRARPEGNTLVVAVTDTGIGIAAADLAKLGDPFFQARSSLSRPYEGTGLGLSVVRGLLGLHGGAIAIESELGKGTLVTIRLPLDCRIVGRKTASAAIETIAHRTKTEAAVSPDRRMKQSA